MSGCQLGIGYGKVMGWVEEAGEQALRHREGSCGGTPALQHIMPSPAQHSANY